MHSPPSSGLLQLFLSNHHAATPYIATIPRIALWPCSLPCCTPHCGVWARNSAESDSRAATNMSSQAQDNLYEHSDGEADAQASENPGGDELMSPADGYFGSHRDGEPTRARYAGGTGPTSGQLPVVPNVMVEDPSLQQGSTAEAKAREAAEEQENRHTTERRSSETPQRLAAAEPTEVEGEEQGVDDDGEDGDAVLASPVSRSTHIPQPLVRRAPPHPNRYHIYSDAPPAYSPSPSRSYGTVAHEPTAPHDAYGEDQPLLTPPSPFPEPDMPQGAWRGFTRSKASWGFRKKATLILVAVVIAILVIVMTIGYLMNSGKQVGFL